MHQNISKNLRLYCGANPHFKQKLKQKFSLTIFNLEKARLGISKFRLVLVISITVELIILYNTCWQMLRDGAVTKIYQILPVYP